MKAIKQVVLGLALATCAAFNAYADPIYDYEGVQFVPADFSNPGTLVTWIFGLGDPTVTAGQTFSWDFLFNTPPADPSTSFVFLVGPDTAGSTLFSSLGFYYSSGEAVDNFTLINAGNAVAGAGWVDSGLYDLHVTGTFLVDGAGFSGRAADDVTDLSSAIPEPMSLALMGLGLAGLTAARRRKAA